LKIRTKKQLNLPQLIEWGFENDISNKEFICNEHKAKSVIFNLMGWAEFSDEFSYSPEETFTVEVEKEITEYTRLDKLVVRYRNDDIYIFPQEMIDNFKNDSSVVAFYIPNDDLTMTLIWTKEKGLVE
jgi:hypothetical protein